MVIVYDISTREILYTEQEVMAPQLPMGDTEEKKTALLAEGKSFVGLPYEMGTEVFDYLVALNENNEFIGLQPK